MPALQALEFGYNRMKAVSSNTWPRNSTVQIVNLDSNELDSFQDVCFAVNNLSRFVPLAFRIVCVRLTINGRLQRLILTSNVIGKIDPPLTNRGAPKDNESVSPSPLQRINHLALAFNRIATWYDIDMLHHWCPELESLTLAGNPLIDGESRWAMSSPTWDLDPPESYLLL